MISEEVDRLALMYDGDKCRDASSKIRGFLFQDFIAIKSLLDDPVEYICSECLEDVDVFYQDGKFQIIQAKYYPNSSINRSEVFADLYYQYLRLQMLNSKLCAVPSLYVHKDKDKNVAMPKFDEMKKYVLKGDDLPEKIDYPDEADAKQMLKNEIYTVTGKEAQEKKLFKLMASEESIRSFLDCCRIVHLPDLVTYKTEVMDALARRFPSNDISIDQDNWRQFLFGLAISRIQLRYTLKNPSFDQLKVGQNDFEKYMLNHSQIRKEISIVYYLVSLACEEYSTIICRNSLSDLQVRMLDLIYQNTVQWIQKIGATKEGQYKLFYTVSSREVNEVIKYKDMSADIKLFKIGECRDGFMDVLAYLWKIMLNICQDEVDDAEKISEKSELFDPSHYIDDSVDSYICFHFPEDKAIKHVVILPAVGKKLEGGKRKIIDRMIQIEPRPGKWYMENSKLIWGKNYYNYSTANVCENPSVTDLGEDTFYVECMDCIGVDEGEWSVKESCSTCIFSEECVNEGERK